MSKTTVIRSVLQTSDYSIFKRIPGNRDVLRLRVEKIKKSIETNGWIPSPIIVNEFMQIVDGQGRFEALKTLGLPVEYIVVPGLGMKECVVFNSTQTRWKTRDYIESYAEAGNENYIRLKSLLDEFSQFSESIVLFVYNNSKKLDVSVVPAGTLKFDDEHFRMCKRILTNLAPYSEICKLIRGNSTFFLEAVIFASGLEEVSSKILLAKCQKNISMAGMIVDMRSALTALETIYNFKASKGARVYLVTAYDKYLCGTYPWYAKKYLAKLSGGV